MVTRQNRKGERAEHQGVGQEKDPKADLERLSRDLIKEFLWNDGVELFLILLVL